MSNCLLIQHIPAETGFTISDKLAEHGVEIDTRQIFAGDLVPENALAYDGVVIMGGPMSVSSDEGFPTRRAELDLIRQAVDLGLPVLGVCLGAQLLAAAMGGKVYPGVAGAEIGWGPVELLSECDADEMLMGIPKLLDVMHWHGDTFDLPIGAVRLATNQRYLNQAFRIGDCAWGLQFHLEVTASAVDGFLDAFPEEAEAVPGGADTIRKATAGALAKLQEPRDVIFGRFATLVGTSVNKGDLVELD